MRESELVIKISGYLNRYHIRNSKEIRMGIGVPDLVLNIGAPKNLVPINNYYLLAMCEYLHINKNSTIDELALHFSFDKNKMFEYIQQLVSLDIIIFSKGRVRLKRKIFNLNLGKTISIEAKIKDWKNGILQAQRYLKFSDYSYLVLPDDTIRDSVVNEIENQGIGLISVLNNNDLQEIIHPPISEQTNYIQKYLATSTIIQENMGITKRINDKIFSRL